MKKFLIDGNNLINAHPKLKSIFQKNKDDARENLEIIINDFLLEKNNEATIFLDGFESQHSFYKRNKKLSIKYSKTKTADELIKRTIDNEKNKRILVVVSSDIEIMKYARLNGCDVYSSQAFIKHLKREIGNATSDIKPSNTEDFEFFKELFNKSERKQKD